MYTLPYNAIGSAIYFSEYLETNKDIVVSFDYACYGTSVSGSEGFCVFFTSTFADIVYGGSPGPGLGYNAVSGIDAPVPTLGLEAALLGVGFDLTGYFGSSIYSQHGYVDAIPNSITLRDEQGKDYDVLSRTVDLSNAIYPVQHSLYEQIFHNSAPTFKRVRVRLTDFGQRVVVDLKNPSDPSFTTYLEHTFTDKYWPTTVRCGLAYTSGEITNTTFKVKGLNLNGSIRNVNSSSSDTFTYIVDTNTLSATVDYIYPESPYLLQGERLNPVNINIPHDTTSTAITGLPLVIATPGRGSPGAPYKSGNDYMGVTRNF